MTTSHFAYDSSDYESGSDDNRPVHPDSSPGVPAGEVYANAGRMRAQLGFRKPLHDSDEVSEASAASHRLSSHIPYPTHAPPQSRWQQVNLVELNSVQEDESLWKYQASNMMPQQIGLTYRSLLPSQRQQTLDALPDDSDKERYPDCTLAQVQPSSNPYHWENPADDRNNVFLVAKAPWVRSNEIVRRQAGTLKRNAAVRRNRKKRTIPTSDIVVDAVSATSVLPVERKAISYDRVLSRPKMHRSFSFENEEQRADPSIIWEQAEEELLSGPSSITRVDSGVVQVSVTQLHEELEERPRIARTFSQIFGSEPFVPTALLDAEEVNTWKHKAITLST